MKERQPIMMTGHFAKLGVFFCSELGIASVSKKKKSIFSIIQRMLEFQLS